MELGLGLLLFKSEVFIFLRISFGLWFYRLIHVERLAHPFAHVRCPFRGERVTVEAAGGPGRSTLSNNLILACCVKYTLQPSMEIAQYFVGLRVIA